MKYNTQEKALPLPEYGRAVQKMVDHALTIEDRAERQRCANTIIAVMADFKLDIDYPYELADPSTMHPTPERLSYPKGNIRYRHYGRCIEEMMTKACEMPDGEERDELLRLIAAQMKKDYVLWNKDGVEDSKIIEDIRDYSNGQICLSEEKLNLGVYRAPQQHKQNGKNQKKKNKKKY
ncbi:MAG: DUF4290 domain-containing protein [Bacteroidaceae bacterium]|nr:DUF4290 domain-containing protein [Bacteroidaceae bacterium]